MLNCCYMTGIITQRVLIKGEALSDTTELGHKNTFQLCELLELVT